jgi:hypothetical protein
VSLIQRSRRHRFSVDNLRYPRKTSICACHRFSVDTFIYPQDKKRRHCFSVHKPGKELKKNDS